MGKDGHHDKPQGGLPAWDLRGLFPPKDSPALERLLSSIDTDAKSFADKYKGRVTRLSGGDLGLAISEYEKVTAAAAQVYGCLDLLDAENRENGSFTASIRDRVNKATAATLFFPLDINKIKEADLLEKISSPELSKYAPWVRKVRSRRDYQLDDTAERYLHEKRIVAEDAWMRMFDMTISDLRFDVRSKKLTEAETWHIIQNSSDGALRREAFNEFTRVLSENKSTFALITNTLAEIKKATDSWREFAKPEDSRHLDNQIDGEVVAELVKAVKDNYPRTSHRYYAWKAKQLGQARLHPADRNAPLPGAKTENISWEDAQKTVLAAFAALSPEMAGIGRKFFEENRIDAEPRPFKDGGAFSHPMTPQSQPHISLNYFGGARDVMTLAHELGHGIHQSLAAAQGHLNAQTPLTLAETASIFGEMLAFRNLVDGEEDLIKKRNLLAAKVEDMLDTVVRQTAFFTFEQKLHDERRQKGELAPERIAQIWQETQKEALGPAVNLDVEGAENLWTHIPHFIHSPFYVYSYAFGDCVVNALFDVYDKTPDKKDFVEKYTELLKSGGTKSLGAALAPFGLDVEDPAFWKKGLSRLERYIDEVEALDAKIAAIMKSKTVFKAAANDIVEPQDKDTGHDLKITPKGPAA